MIITNVTGNYFLKENDTATEIRLRIEDSEGNPIDLSTAPRIEVVIGNAQGRLLTKTPILMQSIGELEFGLDEGDILPVGDNNLEVHFFTAAGERHVAPSKGYYRLRVQKAIDSTEVEVTTYTLAYFISEVNRITAGLPELVEHGTEIAGRLDALLDESSTLVSDSTLALAQSQEARDLAAAALEDAEQAGNNAIRAEQAAIAAEQATARAIPAAEGAENARDSAILATNQANQASTSANSAALRAETIAADIEGYDIAISNFNINTAYIKNQNVRFNGSTYKSKVPTQNNPLPVSPAVSNDWWDLVAQRGVDGQGAVASVNGIMPDEDGNVDLGNLATDWDSIAGKPTTFPPEYHTHEIADIIGLEDALENAGGEATRVVQHFTATANQTVFTLATPYLRGRNLIELVVGGIPQFPGLNFTETDDTTVTLSEPVPANTQVTAVYFTDVRNIGSGSIASTTEYGTTILETSITSTSEAKAATPLSVKQVNDAVALKADITDLGIDNIRTGLERPAAGSGTYVRATSTETYQVFIPKVTAVLKNVRLRATTINNPIRFRLHELNEDNTIRTTLIDRTFTPTAAYTLDVGGLVRAGVRYGMGLITFTNGTAVQRLNSTNIGVYEDEYVQVLGRASTADPTPNRDFWVYYYDWMFDTRLQSQLNYFLLNGAISTPDIITSDTPPSNVNLGSIFIQLPALLDEGEG